VNLHGDLLQEGQVTAMICFQMAKAICLGRARRKCLGAVVCSPDVSDLSLLLSPPDLPATVLSTRAVCIQYD